MQCIRLRNQISTFSISQPKYTRTSQMESFCVIRPWKKKNYYKCILKLVLRHYRHVSTAILLNKRFSLSSKSNQTSQYLNVWRLLKGLLSNNQAIVRWPDRIKQKRCTNVLFVCKCPQLCVRALVFAFLTAEEKSHCSNGSLTIYTLLWSLPSYNTPSLNSVTFQRYMTNQLQESHKQLIEHSQTPK